MDRHYGEFRFTTSPLRGKAGDYVGLSLFREDTDSPPVEFAQVTYWYDERHWYVETWSPMPVEIIEELIAEAKSSILTSPDPGREAGG